MNHARRQIARERALRGGVEPPEVAAAREQIRLAMALGQLVHDRRTELGLSEAGLGERLGVAADEVERIEVGGVLPVMSELLLRLAVALDVVVDLHVAGSGASTVAFAVRAA
ncbi:helix-turn-helix domain-containing protein [Yinghuangia seranimata]|uniref:helix-turn-helix domain-containing protein n=1 Tax=Yinghuangia seranimata TaxID=408067 RepID=UPI00248CBAC8|nr:helix-turn-helix transcriptional regulator [Yinghuangia seranimata]MDI2126061.1 helix-turn-helix transcriptional regulator [Yinghuangia seranimata]